MSHEAILSEDQKKIRFRKMILKRKFQNVSNSVNEPTKILEPGNGKIATFAWTLVVFLVVYDPSMNKLWATNNRLVIELGKVKLFVFLVGSHLQKLWLVNELCEWPIESSFTNKNTFTHRSNLGMSLAQGSFTTKNTASWIFIKVFASQSLFPFYHLGQVWATILTLRATLKAS